MARISEAASSQGQLFGSLRDGMEVLDLDQEISFQAYSRYVLPLDGYVFWVPLVEPLVIKGSLHYSQEILQNEDETFGQATVTLTAEQKVTQFESPPINTVYVATANGFRYAFSQQQGLYTQASLWHYFGYSIPPAMASQLLDPPRTIDINQAVTSNSLALWLALSAYKPPYYDWFTNSLQLYPSDLVVPNLVPPYGVVHIPPDGTRSLQAAPVLTPNRSHFQLAADRVRVTLYGLQNNAAQDFLDAVLQYSVNSDNFGIMNMPMVMDGKRTLPELQTIAMQKFIDFEISYHQARVAQVARQLILKAVPITYIFEPA